MSDLSHLDAQYFIDNYVYNCPFCNRRNVAYLVSGVVNFDWSEDKQCRCVIVECQSCRKESMHLSFLSPKFSPLAGTPRGSRWRFLPPDDDEGVACIDDYFFYSVPTSFFVLDDRIPKKLRELFVEAQGCLKSNFLTGASACARKIIYELGVLSKADGDNYADRIKSLKTIHEGVDPTFFDTLLTIQQVTSAKVHENSYDGWEAKHLKVILAALSEVLHEVYVVPALREDRRRKVLALRDELAPASSATAKNDGGSPQ